MKTEGSSRAMLGEAMKEKEAVEHIRILGPIAATLAITVLADLKPGQIVKVAVQRANVARATLDVTLGEYPGTR